MTLRGDVANPFPPESDEVEIEADGDKKDEDEDKEKDDEKDEDKVKAFAIDFDGIAQRILTIPVDTGNYFSLQTSAGAVSGCNLEHGFCTAL